MLSKTIWCLVFALLLLGVGPFTIADEPFQPPANEIFVGTPVPDEIGPGLQIDYTVVLDPGQIVYLDVEESSLPNQLSWKICDSYDRVIRANLSSLAGLGPMTMMGGTYVISVVSESTQNVTYTFQVVDASPQSSSFTIDGPPVVGDLQTPGGRIDYAFSADPGQRVFIDRVEVAVQSAIGWHLVDGLGRTVFGPTPNFTDQGPLVLGGGDYTLSVVSLGGGTTDYEFEVREIPITVEPIGIGQTVAGEILVPRESDRYTFTADPEQEISLNQLSVSFLGGLNWILTDSYGREITRTNNLADAGPFTLLGGDYAVEVTGELDSLGDYSFRVTEVLDGDASLLFGVPMTGAIDVHGEEDRFSFSASAGDLLFLEQISVGNNAGLNWILEDSLNRELLRTANLSSVGPIALMGGDYALTIAGEPGIESDYEFVASLVTHIVQPTTIGAMESAALAPGQRAEYTFSAPAGQLITLDQLSASSTPLLNWVLVDDVGREVVHTNTFNDVTVSLVGGDYTLIVETENGTAQDYSFEIVDDGPTSYTPTGTPASLGVPVASDLDPGEIETYALTVTAGQIVYFDLTQSASALRWTLLDPVGQPVFENVVASSAASGDRGPYVLQAGTHSLSVYTFNGAAASYAFTPYEAPDVTEITSLGEVESGSFTTPGEVRTFEFAVATAPRVYFHSQVSGTGLQWALLDPQGESVFAPQAPSSGVGPFVLEAGTYRLILDPTNSNLPDYQFALVDVSDSTTMTSVGSFIDSAITMPGETHTYTFDVTEGQTVYVDLQQATPSMNWTLFDPVGQLVFTDVSVSSPQQDDQGPFTLVAGTYSLVIDPANANLTDYAFQIWDVEDLASIMTVGETVSGSIADPAGEVVYTFDLATGPQWIYFDNQLAANDLDWTLRDAAGAILFTDEIYTVNADVGPVPLDAGSYELALKPRGGVTPDYQFQTFVVQNAMESLEIDEEISGSIPGPGATVSYTFDSPVNEFIIFDLLSSTGTLEWTLVDPVGEAAGLLEGEAADLPTQDQGPYNLAPGTYTLVFDGDYATTPDYSFTVRPGLAPDPVLVESDWTYTGPVYLGGVQSAHYNPVDGLVYAGVRGGGDGFFCLHPSGLPIFLEATAGTVAGVSTSPTGEVFYSLDGSTRLLRMGQGIWVTSFGPGGRPAGLALAPANYAGPVPVGGLGVVAVRGDGGDDSLWTFDPEAANSGLVLYPTGGDLVDPADVAITDTHVYVADAGARGANGTIWRLEPGGVVADLGVTGLEPVGLAVDPSTGDLLVVDRAGSRVVRIDPETAATSDVITGLILPMANGWASIDVSPDGRQLYVTADGRVHGYRRCDAATVAGEDCNGNGVLDDCDIMQGDSQDCNGNGVPDECDIADGTSTDLNGDGIPDECLPCSKMDIVFLVDTSFSMGEDAVALCTLLPSVVDFVAANGISVNAEILGIADNPGGNFNCLGTNARDLLGGSIGLDCGNFLTETTEDWGRATTAVAELYPWSPGSQRVVVVVADEGSYCGDGIDANDTLVVNEAIDAALANDVTVSMIAGQGSSAQVLALGESLASGTGGLLFSITDSVDVIGEAVQDIVITSCPCGVALTELDPPTGTAFPAGTTLTLSGRAAGVDPQRPVVEILVNGEGVDSLDLAGHFFKSVTVAEGSQDFTVEVIQSCGGTAATVTLIGLSATDPAPEIFSDVSLLMTETYTGTTYNHSTETLNVEVQGCNTGSTDVGAPLLLVIEGFTQPGISVVGPDGFTPLGKPYFRFLEDEPVLAAGACTPTRSLAFHTPNQQPVIFEVTWLAADNAPPVFDSIPDVSAVAGGGYLYPASAFDPEGEPLTFALELAPTGMAVDPITGEITWSPQLADVGAHSVRLVASDPRSGSTTQAYLLEVVAVAVNHAPFFSSVPPTQSPVGTTYSYAAMATDSDGDLLSFTLIDGPVDMAVTPQGLLSWPFTLPGSYPVHLLVEDGLGGTAEQQYLLTVGAVATNPHAPQLFGTPAAVAVVDQLYFYQPAASDADPGDILEFTLTVSPAGMTVDPVVGLVEWVPTDTQVGTQLVTLLVDDGHGASTAQSWTLEVAAELDNHPPVILTVPAFFTEVGQLYEYTVGALDLDLDPVTYELVSPPAGMSIDGTSGLVSWTPASEGPFTVAVRAVDPQGAFGSQVYTLTVIPPNAAPTITSVPVTTTVVGAHYLYGLEASDADGHVLTFSLLEGPEGMTVGATTGIVAWTPGADDLGTHPVALLVHDGFQGAATQSFDLEVGADVNPPIVTVTASQDVAPLGQAILVTVGAADDVDVVDRTLSVDGSPVALDAFAQFVFEGTTPGDYLLDATATDPAGNVGVATLVVTLVEPDLDRPVVTLFSPSPDAEVTEPTDIVVSIDDNDPTNLTWTVSYRANDEAEFHEIAAGAGVVDQATVATFDPTTLPNGSYWIQVLGTDGLGNEGGLEFRVQVVGDLKLGLYSTSFVDLAIPLAGIPIAVIRQYSTLDLTPGDFGVGWRLGLPGDVRDDPAEFPHPQPLIDDLNDAPFTPGTRVYVTMPDGRRVGFTFEPTPTQFPFVVNAAFTADPGVEASLEGLPRFGEGVLLFTGTAYFEFIFPYNPVRYVLTTEEGVQYTMHEDDGLEKIEDIFGNTIDVTPKGLFSSTGVSVQFDRNDDGWITAVTEPSADGQTPGGTIEYEYDALGNLVLVRDQAGEETLFTYDERAYPNHLTGIEDPLQRPLVFNVYGDDGRLVASCGPGDDLATLDGCVTFDTDPGTRTQTIFDAGGQRTDLVFDERGRLVDEIRYLDREPLLVHRTYDEAGHLLTETDPNDNTYTYAYDDRGNIVSMTSPAGHTWIYTYDVNDNLIMLCDPLGNCTSTTYDDQRRPLQRIGALGQVETFTWTAQGQLESVTDDNGNTWLYFYTLEGHLEQVVYPDLAEESFTRDAIGQVTSRTDRNGRTMTFEYDELHRLLEEQWGNPPVEVLSFQYDAVGHFTSATSSNSQITFEYWPTGLLKQANYASVNGSTAHSVAYGLEDSGQLVSGYNATNRLTHVFDSFGGMTEYTYDDLGRRTGILQYGVDPMILDRNAVAVPVSDKSLTFEYDDASLLMAIRRYGDLSGAVPGIDTAFDYDCGGCPSRVSSIEHRRVVDDVVLHHLTFLRDAAGDVIEMTDTEGTHVFQNDGSRRLLAATRPLAGPQPDESYEYDGVGNRLSSHLSGDSVHGYQVDPDGSGNTLVQDDGYDYEYDAEGNLVRKTSLADGEVTEYEYDYRGRLVSVEHLDPQENPLWVASYTYDAIGRRIRSEENGVVRQYVYDREDVTVVLDGAGEVVKRHLLSGVMDGVYGYEQDGETYWLLRDAVDSVRDIVDSSGNVQRHYIYDSFGTVVGGSGTLENDIRFQSREYSELTGLYYFRARYYDSAIGRFLSEDPRRPHRYEFGLNDPQLFRDPTGEVAAIEYACQAIDAISTVFTVLSIVNPVTELWNTVAIAVVTLTEPPQGGYGAAIKFLEAIVKATRDALIEEIVSEIDPNAGCALKAFNIVKTATGDDPIYNVPVGLPGGPQI